MSATAIASERLFTAEDVATFTRVPLKSVYRALERGELSCVRLGPKRIRFRPGDIEEWCSPHPASRRAIS